MKPDPSSVGLDRYEALGRRLAATHGVDVSRMFGMPALKSAGKVFAGFYDGCMTFRLPEPVRSQALGLPEARLFDPSGRGRPMREWVQVPATSEAEWQRLADAALGYLKAGK